MNLHVFFHLEKHQPAAPKPSLTISHGVIAVRTNRSGHDENALRSR